MKLQTCAKLNLSLLVYRARKDGYHPLCSIFQSIQLHDILTINKTNKHSLSITTSNTSLPTDNQNIISKIYNHYKDKLSYGYSVNIIKRIPMGGGLGGGSSNAAGFLYALNKYEQWNFSLKQLAKMGLKFGADIPFFFYGPTALVRGIGEKITPLPMKNSQHFVLINPNIHSSTGDIFRLFDSITPPVIPTKTPKDILTHYYGPNDLLPIVCRLYPEINHFYTQTKKIYPTLSMSGSGATFFIPCNKSEIQRIQDTLRKNFPSYYIDAVSSCPYTIKEI